MPPGQWLSKKFNAIKLYIDIFQNNIISTLIAFYDVERDAERGCMVSPLLFNLYSEIMITKEDGHGGPRPRRESHSTESVLRISDMLMVRVGDCWIGWLIAGLLGYCEDW